MSTHKNIDIFLVIEGEEPIQSFISDFDAQRFVKELERPNPGFNKNKELKVKKIKGRL